MTICPHFGVCGGCSRQDHPYEQQLKDKESLVREALHEVTVESWQLILASPEATFYRNKMEFSFGDQRDVQILNTPREKKVKRIPGEAKIPLAVCDSGQVHLGLHPRKRFNLVTPTPGCQLLSPGSQKITHIVGAWATEFNIVTFTRHNHQGVLRHCIIREGKNTDERMVNLFSTSAVTHLDELAEALKNSNIPITTFMWTANDGLSDVARGEPTKIFWGDGLIKEKVGDILIRVPPSSFMQTNTHASERMIRLLDSWIEEDSGKNAGAKPALLFDLYCGAGTIGLNLAKRFERLVGIESDAAAVKEAVENAVLNQCQNAAFHAGRVEDLLSILQEAGPLNQAYLVVDPPRPGLHTKVVDAINQSGIPYVYYVSCNPLSLARDLRLLEAKYRIVSVQPMDFFPHTDHVETAVKLQIQ